MSFISSFGGSFIRAFLASGQGGKCNVYLFDGAEPDYFELSSAFSGNFKMLVASADEVGIPAEIVAGRQGDFVASANALNDPQWNQYEMTAVGLLLLVGATFSGRISYALDDVWYHIDKLPTLGEESWTYGDVLGLDNPPQYALLASSPNILITVGITFKVTMTNATNTSLRYKLDSATIDFPAMGTTTRYFTVANDSTKRHYLQTVFIDTVGDVTDISSRSVIFNEPFVINEQPDNWQKGECDWEWFPGLIATTQLEADTEMEDFN